MVGSGTSTQVAKEMGIDAVGLDLHSGFNILRDSILAAVQRPADLCISHPPYGGQILYSGEVWGDAPHPDDLSRCIDDADFHEKLQVALLNQRESVKGDGIYGTIIGDWRRQGKYTSYQAECIARMPASELVSVIIKQQHNTTSGRKSYGPMVFPLIEHEYILLWRKKSCTTYHLLSTMAIEQGKRLRGVWRTIIRTVMISLGGKASLKDIYQSVAIGCPDRIKQNPHWQEKVRQVLNSTGDYRSVERGVWQLS